MTDLIKEMIAEAEFHAPDPVSVLLKRGADEIERLQKQVLYFEGKYDERDDKVGELMTEIERLRGNDA